MTDWRKQLLDDVEQRKKKNVIDTLKAKRTYADEVKKASPEYKETQRKKAETARINAETNLKKARKEAKPESGTEAVDRILKEIKTARGNVESGGKPIYPEDFPAIQPSATGLHDQSGYPGTPSNIGRKRVKELEKQLATAQSAKESGKSIAQAGMDEAVQAKYLEYIKFFDQPRVQDTQYNFSGRYVPKEKSRHLAELATREWFKKTYGQ